MQEKTKETAKEVLTTAVNITKDVAVGILRVTFGTLKFLSQSVLDACEGKTPKKEG